MVPTPLDNGLAEEYCINCLGFELYCDPYMPEKIVCLSCDMWYYDYEELKLIRGIK